MRLNPWQSFVNEITGPWAWLIIVSTLACLAFVVMTFSQFVKCIRTKNTTSLSMFFAIILPVTNTLITIYDLIFFVIALNDGDFMWSLLLPAVINGLISAYAVMILKVKHVLAAKRIGMTEAQYYEKYLKPSAHVSKKEKKK